MPKIQDIEQIVFPSQAKVDPAEVERPLRRKFRSERQIPLWMLGLLALLVITILTLLVGRIVTDQAHAEQVSKQITYSSLCTQYKSDMDLEKQDKETLEEVCNAE
jgi:hypothetical protein